MKRNGRGAKFTSRCRGRAGMPGSASISRPARFSTSEPIVAGFPISTTCTRAEIPVLPGRFSWTCSPSPASCFASRDWSFCSCCPAHGHPRGRWWALGSLSPCCSQSFSSIEVAMRVGLSLTLSGAFAAQAFAADVAVVVGIPRLSVAEYHKPYVAIWLERPDQSFVGNIAVWYDFKLKDNEGTKWLKDVRQWWRRSGRELSMPVDGLSSATRAPGDHWITVSTDRAPLQGLPQGEYHLVIEAAREVGGREILRIPFQWPVRSAENLKVQGGHELATIELQLKP